MSGVPCGACMVRGGQMESYRNQMFDRLGVSTEEAAAATSPELARLEDQMTQVLHGTQTAGAHSFASVHEARHATSAATAATQRRLQSLPRRIKSAGHSDVCAAGDATALRGNTAAQSSQQAQPQFQRLSSPHAFQPLAHDRKLPPRN